LVIVGEAATGPPRRRVTNLALEMAKYSGVYEFPTGVFLKPLIRDIDITVG
jgi:hypothetical protein